MKLRSWMLLFLAGVMAFGLLAACGDDDDDGQASNSDADHEDDEHDEGMDDMAFDREITLKMSDTLKFEPDTIRLKVGERIRLVADNEEGTALHDFSVEMMAVHDVMMEGAEHGHDDAMSDFALHVAADPGEHGVLFFTAEEPGEYEFFCSVLGHREAGMKGTIVVEE